MLPGVAVALVLLPASIEIEVPGLIGVEQADNNKIPAASVNAGHRILFKGNPPGQTDCRFSQA